MIYASCGRLVVLAMTPSGGVVGERGSAVGALTLLLLVGMILVLAVLLGTLVLVRSARRQRAGTDRKRSPPTASEDVWAMHKLPADLEEDESDWY